MSVTVTEIRMSQLRVVPLRVAVAPSSSALDGDHGSLSGLTDDDHPQYLTQSRGDGRYSALTHTHEGDGSWPLAVSATQAADAALFDPTAGDPETGMFQMCASSHAWNNGPVGNANYFNNVASLGWNIKAPSEQDVAGVSGFCMTMENRYYNGSSFVSEWQLRGIRPNGTQFRPMEINSPHNGIGNSASFRVSHWFIGSEQTSDVYIDARLGDLDTNTGPGVIEVLGDIRFEFAHNNRIVSEQRNAANTAYLALPYFNANDRLLLSTQPVELNPAMTGGTPMFALSGQGVTPNGAIGTAVSFPATTNATISATQASGNTNWEIKTQLINYHSSGAATDEIQCGPYGYANQRFTDGTTPWALGRDPDGHFRISQSGYTYNNDTGAVVTVDKTNLNAKFAKPPKVPTYTVSTTPSAATYGSGSLIYVSDENGGGVVAFSDGTNWRRMTDRAVVS